MRRPGTGKVFRRTVKNNGEAKCLPAWYYWYVDVDGRKKTRRGYSDRAATEEALRAVQKRIAQQLEGLRLPSQDELRTPLAGHLSDFMVHLEAGAVTKKHLSMTDSRLTRALRTMRADLFSDLTLPKAEQFLLDMQREGAAKKTVNDHSAALKQFTAWLGVTKGWTDPLAGLSRLKGEDDVRVRRTALTPAQLQRLFEAAERRGAEHYREAHPNGRPEAVERLRRSGMERAMIYRLGALAGLRLNEVRTLTWGCLDLDSDPPRLTVDARYAKSRRRDTVPVNSGLAAALRGWRAAQARELGRPPRGNERVVKVPRHLTDEQFRKDCAFADIPLRDDTGAVLDLYAATRHTFCTLLGKAGVPPHQQRLLARHADLSTTLKYTHFQVIDLVEGIEALPDLTTEGEVERADYLRNAGRSQAQSAARECNEEGLGVGTSAGLGEDVKGLPVQDLASPCNATQEVSNSLPTNELWWRRRESNPRPRARPLKLLRT